MLLLNVYLASAQKKEPRISNLTGIRGLAALWVFIFHYQDYFLRLIPNYEVLNRIFLHGAFGVDLFFCLSGFILSFVYFESFSKSDKESKKKLLKEFYIKRFARLYPLYFITTIIATTLFAIAFITGYQFKNEPSSKLSLMNLASNVMGIQQWFNLDSINGPAWSVSAEFAAYLIFPFLIWTLNKFRKRVSFLTLLTFIFAFCVYQASIRYNLYWNQNMYRLISEFTMGMCSFLLVKNWMISYKKIRIARGLCLILIVIILQSIEDDLILKSIVPMLLLALVVLNYFHNYPGKGLSRKIYLSLGVWSYSLYLIHVPLRQLLSGVNFPNYDVGILLRIFQALVLLLLPIILSSIVTKYVEEPSRLYILKKWLP